MNGPFIIFKYILRKDRKIVEKQPHYLIYRGSTKYPQEEGFGKRKVSGRGRLVTAGARKSNLHTV